MPTLSGEDITAEVAALKIAVQEILRVLASNPALRQEMLQLGLQRLSDSKAWNAPYGPNPELVQKAYTRLKELFEQL